MFIIFFFLIFYLLIAVCYATQKHTTSNGKMVRKTYENKSIIEMALKTFFYAALIDH